jgi:hypothetical protein
MGKQTYFYLDLLKSELDARAKKNPRYSLRAFALFLGIDAGCLSRCLSLKQSMSLEIAEKVIAKLHLDEVKRKQFLLSISEQQRCMILKKHDTALIECEK